MKIKVGDKLDPIMLPRSDGSSFTTESLIGKRYLLTFYRFASCPLCNLRIHELIERQKEFGEKFEMVGIFHSSVENLQTYTNRHKSPFPILADEFLSYFRKYDVERSVLAFVKSQITRGPKICRALMRGFIPYRIKGSLTILPVDILINESGVVEQVKYGRDIGDHLTFDEIKNFAHSR